MTEEQAKRLIIQGQCKKHDCLLVPQANPGYVGHMTEFGVAFRCSYEVHSSNLLSAAISAESSLDELPCSIPDWEFLVVAH